MITPSRRRSSGFRRAREVKSMRASVTFPPSIYEELERIATAKKVSIAWVVREAAEKYVADQYPLFAQAERERHS